MIQIAVCDDEAYMTEMLASKISSFFKNEKIEVSISLFTSGKDLLSSNKKFDIIFLDVLMEKPDGFETAKRLRSSRGFCGHIIFVTVMESEVFRAFEVQAFDYLIKPLQENNFMKTMNRLILSIKEQGEKQLLVQKGFEWSMIPFSDIVYCEIIDRKVYLHLKNEEVVDYYDKIAALEKKLDNRFFKCHRSYLINLQHLKSYKRGMAYLANNETVPVSRLRSGDFSEAVLQYMGSGRCGGWFH